MIEGIALVFRTLQLVCGCSVLGVLSYAQMRRAVDLPALPLYRPALALATGFIIAGVGTLASEAALVTGVGDDLWNIAVWNEVLVSTRFGLVWCWREGLMVVVLSSTALRLMFPQLPQERRHLAFTWIVAMAGLALAAAVGHAAAAEPAWPLALTHALHLIAAAIWIGSLLPLILELRRAAREYSHAPATAQLFQRFARVAAKSMPFILISGVVLALSLVGRFPALLGTSYGIWLFTKLIFVVLVLAVAAKLRWSFLQSFSDMPPGLAARYAWRWVTVEFALACCVFLCACILGFQAPARHEEITWWLPFRFAPDITWSLPGVAIQATTGLILIVAGVWLFMILRRRRSMLSFGAIALSVTGLVITLPPLVVPAFPDTYRISTVSYHASSIDNGAQLFRRHCSACHGSSGVGDGPLAPTLKLPPDLTSPNAADHTAGDLYWWISRGIVAGNMPGFSQTLTEEERWDVVNFLHALSAGYQSRVIGATAVPGKPWLVAPDFNYITQYGVAGALSEFRGKKPLMLVLFSWPQSKARLDWLDDNRGAIQDNGAEFIAVPLAPIPDKELDAIRVPLAVQGADDIASTYRLLRWTPARADAADNATPPTHLEFLIDRFGYVRAKWLPGEGEEWNDAGFIANQIQRLNAEPEILPAPDDYIH